LCSRKQRGKCKSILGREKRPASSWACGPSRGWGGLSQGSDQKPWTSQHPPSCASSTGSTFSRQLIDSLPQPCTPEKQGDRRRGLREVEHSLKSTGQASAWKDEAMEVGLFLGE
jgi:hypothetical protein